MSGTLPPSPARKTAAIEAFDLVKTFRTGQEVVRAVRGISLEVAKGEVVSLEGPSGSGKTTLLCILGCMLTPDSGRLFLDGVEVRADRPRLLPKFRREAIGFVFQQFNLFPALNVTENILYALKIKGMRGPAARREAGRVIEAVGLSHRRNAKPRQLSGGQKQRVAIARALAGPARVILADEPTANLDAATGVQILELFRDLARREDRAVVIVTHDHKVRRVADRVCRIEDGLLSELDDEAPAHEDAPARNEPAEEPVPVPVSVAPRLEPLTLAPAVPLRPLAVALSPILPEVQPPAVPTRVPAAWMPVDESDELPPPWSDGDVGGPAISGSASHAAGRFTATGAGAGVSGWADQYHSIDRMQRGNGEVVVRVSRLDGATSAGVMIRATSDPSAKFAAIVIGPGREVALAWRDAEAAEVSRNVAPTSAGLDEPLWLKLARHGDVFAGAASSDGAAFTPLGAARVGMARNVFLSLFVAGDAGASVGRAEFDEVSVGPC